MTITSIYTAIYDRNGDPEYLGCLIQSRVEAFKRDYASDNPECDLYTQVATPEQIAQEMKDNVKIVEVMGERS